MACLRIGDTCPDFKSDSSIGEISLYEYLGDGWGVFFSHPADFTPVCTTELGMTAKLVGEFAKRNTKPLAISVDPADSHREWIKDINDTQSCSVEYPIIADPDRTVANLYGMIHPNAPDTKAGQLTVRTVFVIAPDRTLKMSLTYPASTGRNFYEILRVIDSLQLTAYKKVATPANWEKGQDCVVVPSVSTEDAKGLFGDVNEVRPWLRLVKDPSDQ